MIILNDKPITIKKVGIVGWAGRDPEAVQAHINELAELGVKPPSSFPLVYHVSPAVVTQAEIVDFLGNNHSGEVEVCIVSDDNQNLWVTLASDHTDRELESVDVAFSKQVCAKPLATEAWCLSEVINHWDELTLVCDIQTDSYSEYKRYQVGQINGLLHIDDIFKQLPKELLKNGKPKPNTLLLCGTLSAIGGINSNAIAYKMSLQDPILDREINHNYQVNNLIRNQ